MPKYCLLVLLLLCPALCCARSDSSGSVSGLVTDQTGAPVPSADVVLSNSGTVWSRQIQTDSAGVFTLRNIPEGDFLLRISATGYSTTASVVKVNAAEAVRVSIQLNVAGQRTTVNVVSGPEHALDTDPGARVMLGRKLIAALPAVSPDSGLNDAVVYTTPGVAADSNGFFHPLGDHAQVSYVIDGQPISDQRNKVFSTSIPVNAIQSVEIISGSPQAEYGDKTSLIVNAAARSGLGQKPSGTFAAQYGSFGSIGEEATFAAGGTRWGEFIAVNTERSGRFLDTPEFWPMHDIGNTGTIFDRLDFQPSAQNIFHVNLMAARNWMQVPNTYEQPGQDQRQKVVSFNIAPGYQRTIGSRGLYTLNTFVRGDQVNYFGSRDPFDDSPATLAQTRSLLNFGVRTDLSHVNGRHNWKVGVSAVETQLDEKFRLGITDPLYNSPCFNTPGFKSTSDCAAAGLEENANFLSGLIPYDLTRDGKLYEFRGRANIRQLAAFAQDSIAIGNLTFSLGVRFDRYVGLTGGGGFQPRSAFSYLFKPTGTVIRGGFSHTIETPVNENLVASSATGRGGLASNLFDGSAEQIPIALGSRNQYDAGIQQNLGRWLVLDVSYFRKYTRNAFDFDALFSTPITFPIGWKQSKLDGVSARLTTPEFHGARLFATMGHANARFFGPENGGIIFNSNLSVGAYRQDHDQVYQQNVNLHYQPRKDGWWTDFAWRYDSGLVVGAVNGLEDALALTADQQTAVGLYCGTERASLVQRISECSSAVYGAQRIKILAPGTANADRNPPRTTSRHIFNLAVGTDNLFRTERLHTSVRFTAINLSSEAALYNFLSPFSGTHWVQPRSYQLRLGWNF